MKAEIVSIGTELLLGDIVDTNAAHIAQSLRGIGLDLLYKTTVGDNQQRIADVIDHALNRVDIVITSGGLGPTVDDVTREAIAQVTQRPLEFSQELLDQIAERFKRFGAEMSDNNRRQAMIPQGAIPVENPVGTAPIFILVIDRGVIMVLPGVPREMKHLLEHSLLPWLRDYMGTPSIIKTRVLRTAGIGESQIDSRIGDLMTASNPTVGLAAHSGQVDIRITAKAETEAEASQLIAPIEDELRRRVGAWIYGGEKESIEQILVDLLEQRNLRLSVIEMGTNETVRQRLEAVDGAKTVLASIREGSSLDSSRNKWSATTTLDDVARMAAEAELKVAEANFVMAVVIQSENDHPLPRGTAIAVVSPTATRLRSFGWSADRADIAVWATTHAFAMLRRALISAPEPT